MIKKKAVSAFTAALMIAVSGVFTSCSRDTENSEKDSTDATEAEEAAVTEVTEEEDVYVPPVYVECQNSEIHRGQLILVNRDYEYTDGYNPELVNIYANKTGNYNVNRTDMELDRVMVDAVNSMLDDFAAKSGITNVLCNSGYRTYNEQKEMYEEDLEYTGLEESYLVAPPGHSEHHTGYAMDFAVDDGYEYPALRNEGEYSWIYDNAHNYGMFLRYTEQNKHITGYMAESWHFRYVGPIHATLIWKMGVAYEQYIGFLKDFKFDNPLEYRHSDDEFYRIYYVPASFEGNSTEIPVPLESAGAKDGEMWSYTISGNNCDGFIVTLRIPELSDDYDDTYLYMFNPVDAIRDVQNSAPAEREKTEFFDDTWNEESEETADDSDDASEDEESDSENEDIEISEGW